MKTRIITAIIALAIFIPLIVYGQWPLTIAALALGVVAIAEILIMKKMFLISFEAVVSYLGVMLLILPDQWLDWLPSATTRWSAFYFLVLLLLLHTVIRRQRFTFDDAGVLTLGMLYVGLGFHYFIAARAINFETLLYGMLVVWITDSGAYLIGRKLGKNKLAPKISPNKTWEGSIGGTVSATIIMAIYLYFIPVGGHYVTMVILTLLLSVVGQFGDLIESSLKRFYGVKDSGKILPGHGGILDRFDSMLLVMPVMHFLGII
ncbi:phosphatidate cytidylyltransferase [Limosilactobacillus frumenti DSM 13145]|uniref:Phosphatidate cytidylyltransferase n=1 Tax=Limosilactobacillus frumenti DSM 13145 TaxID=1423746 RepID=A0A0R1P3X1_9LACO|nr:phosphatidate cytidylyltransferase [Limosilactobacillus frumenti]KRL26991.1 phosphatidate cytidylyltransferase [Limosilactobacillus frumenti DSM 13145]MBA2914473.1 phosphatidate cytidylyltransferase [Limosilactobacillus frumenti]QFG72468.1 phosphatidate cytidylyltransferase [Limosilactobacillus frumenti]